jgi:nucleoside-diphosphate-sugar epimerase
MPAYRKLTEMGRRPRLVAQSKYTKQKIVEQYKTLTDGLELQMTDPGILLVTGGSGFLGSAIVALARQSRCKVRIFDRSPKERVDDVELVVGDLSDDSAVRGACDGVSTIIHAAGLAHGFGNKARDFGRLTLANEMGTDNLVKAGLDAGVSRIVLVSSVAVYGRTDGATLDETTKCAPESPYAVSKWRAELRTMERMDDSTAELAILRFATIYGVGDSGNVARLIRSLTLSPFIGFGTGLNRKSLIYKDDAARACLLASKGSGSRFRVFNVSGNTSTMRDIVASICEALGRPQPRLWLHRDLVKLVSLTANALGDPFQVSQAIGAFTRDDSYSSARFEREYEFRALTPLPEGIRNEVAWLADATKQAKASPPSGPIYNL